METARIGTDASLDRKYRYWRSRVFGTLFVAYGSYYLCRVNFSVALPEIQKTLGASKAEVGAIATALYAAYAIGQVVNGQLGDRVGGRVMMLVGMLVSALMNLLFGFGHALGFLIAVWAVNGYFQATGWPSIMKIMAAWFTQKERGTIMGWFSTNYQIGNVLAWLLAGYLVEKLGWRATFWVPAAIFGVLSILVYMGTRDAPEQVGLPPVEAYRGDAEQVKSEREDIYPGFRYTLRKTFLNKWVWLLGVIYLAIDYARYGLMTWAPTFILEVQHAPLKQSAFKAAILPLLGSVGSIFAGWASDKWFGARRGPISAIMLFGLAIFTYLFRIVPGNNWVLSLVVLGLAGFCLYGPHSLLGGAAAMDFGTRKAAASAAGFIDALGYVGAILAGWGSGMLIDHYSWTAAFISWVLAALLGAILSAVMWNVKPSQEE